VSEPATNGTPDAPQPNAAAAVEALRKTIPLLVVGVCPLCSSPISRREQGEYLGTVTHRHCSLQQQITDTNADLDRLREEFNVLRSYLVGPIPKGAN
jgi:hypothetical protein